MAAPKAIVIPALTKHTATVICAHGLGDKCVPSLPELEKDFMTDVPSTAEQDGKMYLKKNANCIW